MGRGCVRINFVYIVSSDIYLGEQLFINRPIVKIFRTHEAAQKYIEAIPDISYDEDLNVWVTTNLTSSYESKYWIDCYELEDS